jgi:hypothetical protein
MACIYRDRERKKGEKERRENRIDKNGERERGENRWLLLNRLHLKGRREIG